MTGNITEKRINIILNHIKHKKEVTLRELCALFPDYNEMTIRRDLITLEKHGYINRVRGGAVLCENPLSDCFNYHHRSVTATDQKRYIATRALALITDSTSVYMDASTTVLELAKILPDISLSVTTNMPTILMELLKKNYIDVMITGGTLNKSVVSLSGPTAFYALEKINIDTAFIGTAGFSLEHGFTNALYNECELKKKAIASASKIVLLVDSTKIGKSLPYTFATLADIDILITDKPLPPDLNDAAQKNNVLVIC